MNLNALRFSVLIACLVFDFVGMNVVARPAYGVERTVVLTNGNVVQGNVQQLADRVIVRTPTSEVRFATHDVEIVGRSLLDAYQQKSRAISNAPSAREKLVVWCLKNNLKAEAKREYETLRRHFPKYSRLEMLEQRIRSFRSDLKPATLPSRSPLHPDTQFAQDRLDKLSKKTLSDYVRAVQPLLMNRCGIAGCHGKATATSLQLVGLGRSSMTLNLTHRNLGATLRRVDGPAAQSLLWMSASSIHGGMKRGMSSKELDKLYPWIDRVSKELEGERKNTGAVQQVAATFAPDGSDPFDPAEFNARQ